MKPLHQGISIPDMDATIEWYSKMFGCTVISDEYMEALNSRIVFMSLGEFQLEFFEYTGKDQKALPTERRIPNEDIKTCGTKHVAYAVDDINKLVNSLKEKGADIAVPVFGMNEDLVCFIRDNSGVLIELIESQK